MNSYNREKQPVEILDFEKKGWLKCDYASGSPSGRAGGVPAKMIGSRQLRINGEPEALSWGKRNSAQNPLFFWKRKEKREKRKEGEGGCGAGTVAYPNGW